jgi:predicted nuclease with TOPRIM domain
MTYREDNSDKNFQVMKTLEIGVEALQREKTALAVERDELKAKLEASEKNSAILTEQVSYLNERNSTLSKKCVDLLDGSKEYREKFDINSIIGPDKLQF